MTPAQAMRQLRARRKAAGVCIYCEDPLTTETMCERHAEAKRTGTGADGDARQTPVSGYEATSEIDIQEEDEQHEQD